jgi:dUTP pyrophosphatase
MHYTLEILPTTPEANSFYTSGERDNQNAGVDIFVPEETTFAPGEKKLVSMRVKAKVIKYNFDILPTGMHYWMLPRSSISKTGLMLCNSVGVIDSSYRGELMAFLWNTTDKDVTVKKGDRLVQIVAPDMGWIKVVKLVDELDATERGEGGFGSSGR